MLLLKSMLCSKLHCQKCFNLDLLSYKTWWRGCETCWILPAMSVLGPFPFRTEMATPRRRLLNAIARKQAIITVSGRDRLGLLGWKLKTADDNIFLCFEEPCSNLCTTKDVLDWKGLAWMCGCTMSGHDDGPRCHASVCHTLYSSNGLRKSTPPQNRQLDVRISNSKQ